MLKNFEIYHPKDSTKEFVRNYQQIMQNKPNFSRFSPKNNDSRKKQTQTNPNESNFSSRNLRWLFNLTKIVKKGIIKFFKSDIGDKGAENYRYR
jgi:hypothetical protein